MKNTSISPVKIGDASLGSTIGSGGPFDENALDVLKSRNLNLIQGMTDKVANDMSREIADGMLSGESVYEISARIKNVPGFTEKYKNQAETISRTETMMAMNTATFNRYREEGVKEVQVVVAIDDRLCDECSEFDMKVYPIEEAPILPAHPACRCTFLASPEEGSEFEAFTEEEIEALRENPSTPRYRREVIDKKYSARS